MLRRVFMVFHIKLAMLCLDAFDADPEADSDCRQAEMLTRCLT
jgi:hypothetical protein